jgi:geranylgeranyl pyrophosphate synthase
MAGRTRVLATAAVAIAVVVALTIVIVAWLIFGGSRRRSRAPPLTLWTAAARTEAMIAAAAARGDYGPDPRFRAACLHAMAGGKRLRPAIVLEVARAAGGADASEAALAVECMHAASLTIDDLPEFDDDAERRGAPSVQAAYGAATARLVAFALAAAAFQCVCRQIDNLKAGGMSSAAADGIGLQLAALVSRTMGAAGAARGQYMELARTELADDLAPGVFAATVGDLKTAAVFEMTVCVGWLVGGGRVEDLDVVAAAGRALGRAYQAADDLGDAGKDAGREVNAASNLALADGADAARAYLEAELDEARRGLRAAGLWSPLWGRELFPAVRRMAIQK